MYNNLPSQKKIITVTIIFCIFAISGGLSWLYINSLHTQSQQTKKIDLSLPNIQWTYYDALRKTGVEDKK